MTKLSYLSLGAAIVALSLIGGSLAAQPPAGKGKGKGGPPAHAGGQPGHADNGGGGVDVDIRIGGYFGDQARRHVRNYHGAHGCPPGLAKKRNGCMPPGQAKKRYSVGQALPSGVTIHGVPRDLRRDLGAPPQGYYYGYVDGDLLLLANATHRVVDAIVAVNAAGNALSD